jgi:cyclin E
MLEVCEEYRIHRETFYLSVDLLDRFMDIQSGVLKEQLQLIGVTCLFIASKIEEIYPPKLADFAYVTDGACLADDIVYTELLICKALNWKLHHYTVSVNTWINIYMQLASSYFRPPGIKAKEFEYPAFSPYEFIRVMQVLDLCTLDISSRQFSSSVLAATALYLVSEKCHLHLNLITGFQLTDIHLCLQWLQPFVTIINRTKPPVQKVFKGVSGITNLNQSNLTWPDQK